MFTLRQQHQSAFQTKAEADFVREVMQYLRENHADTIVKLPNGEFKVADLPEETLRRMIEGGIVKAINYGIILQSTLISFVVIMFVSAPHFDKHPKIKSILEEQVVVPDLRIGEIWKRTNLKLWRN